jgi:hypothetical protein
MSVYRRPQDGFLPLPLQKGEDEGEGFFRCRIFVHLKDRIRLATPYLSLFLIRVGEEKFPAIDAVKTFVAAPRSVALPKDYCANVGRARLRRANQLPNRSSLRILNFSF